VPYPPCTGTALWPTGTTLWRCYRRVTQPPHIAGPLAATDNACLITHEPLNNLNMKTKINPMFWLSNASIILLVVLIPACRSFESTPCIIDPRTFIEREISLSEIADDVAYIPLDNSLPISIIYHTSINILQNSIYLSARDIGIIRFNRDGSDPTVIGKRGRGPGEWQYCMSIAVDDRTESVYVMDNNNEIKVYYKSGDFKGTIKLPESEDGFNFFGISFYNSKFFASQYINMGHARFNWIILDTLGNIISQKLNPIPTFECNIGIAGGTFKFEDKISYWNAYNDTIYSVSPDLNYRPSYIFTHGEGKLPLEPISGGPNFAEIISRYYMTSLILETNRFLLYRYSHNKKVTLALIEKETGQTYKNSATGSDVGIKNDLDGGLPFKPVFYFTEKGNEYLLALIEPLQLKAFVSSEEFQNGNPKFPKKQDSLRLLADKVEESDNQLLMIIRLIKK